MSQNLSYRELEVLRELAQGWTNAEIGQRLLISPQTVKSHVQRIAKKMGTTRRVRIVMFAFRWQLLEFDRGGQIRIVRRA